MMKQSSIYSNEVTSYIVAREWPPTMTARSITLVDHPIHVKQWNNRANPWRHHTRQRDTSFRTKCICVTVVRPLRTELASPRETALYMHACDGQVTIDTNHHQTISGAWLGSRQDTADGAFSSVTSMSPAAHVGSDRYDDDGASALSQYLANAPFGSHASVRYIITLIHFNLKCPSSLLLLLLHPYESLREEAACWGGSLSTY